MTTRSGRPTRTTPHPAASTPRTGRRTGPTGTREALLAAAREAFGEQGYAATSLREIARRAGVDASLIVHFFGSKAGLLTAAVQWPFDPDEVLRHVTAEGPGHIGERLASVVIERWEAAGQDNVVLPLLQAAMTDTRAATLMREFLTVRLVTPTVEYLDADRASLRASMIAAQLLGFAVARYVLGLEGVAECSPEEAAAVLGGTLQRLCADEL